MTVTIISDSAIQLAIDIKLYSAEVLHKCFYWFGNKYVVSIRIDTASSYIVDIALKSGIYTQPDIEELTQKVKTDLIDFKTREIISKETKNIKEILIAKAFAHSDEFDEVPTGDITDPVGFNPEKF